MPFSYRGISRTFGAPVEVGGNSWASQWASEVASFLSDLWMASIEIFGRSRLASEALICSAERVLFSNESSTDCVLENRWSNVQSCDLNRAAAKTAWQRTPITTRRQLTFQR